MDRDDKIYDLATQTVNHFRSYFSEEATGKVLRLYQRDLANFIHVQMQQHYREEKVDYELVVSKGFTDLKQSAFAATTEAQLNFRQSPTDKSMAKYLFTGFSRCLYPVQNLHSEVERILAVILDRELKKWFKAVDGPFQIFINPAPATRVSARLRGRDGRRNLHN